MEERRDGACRRTDVFLARFNFFECMTLDAGDFFAAARTDFFKGSVIESGTDSPGGRDFSLTAARNGTAAFRVSRWNTTIIKTAAVNEPANTTDDIF